MGCYAVPALAGLVHHLMQKNISSWKTSRYHQWLSMMFLGGAIFGIVDHLWNWELFMIGDNFLMDMMLGVTITVVILVAWSVMVVVDRLSLKKRQKLRNII